MANGNGQLAALTAMAQELVDRINALNQDSDETVLHLAKATKANRRWINVIMIGFALDIVLTISMAFVGHTLAVNTRHINQVTARLDDAQTVQRAKALCPLYQIFLDSEKFAPPNQTPDEITRRGAAFAVIHSGYDALDCKTLLHK